MNDSLLCFREFQQLPSAFEFPNFNISNDREIKRGRIPK